MHSGTPERSRKTAEARLVAAAIGTAVVVGTFAFVGWVGSRQAARSVLPEALAVAIDDGPEVDEADTIQPIGSTEWLPVNSGATAAGTHHGPTAIERARAAVDRAEASYRAIHDYTCTFQKREWIEGKLTDPQIMAMKVRTAPESLYFRFVQPYRGREAIFEAAKHQGKIVAHDVGLGRLFGGTMILDPRGTMAMEGNRHPVDEAGIGGLIRSVRGAWGHELDAAETIVSVHTRGHALGRPCELVEVTHPDRKADFRFHKVKLYLDEENGLPIHFEAYEWPSAGIASFLIEEYSYRELRLNLGLTDLDFDPANPTYSFGRF